MKGVVFLFMKFNFDKEVFIYKIKELWSSISESAKSGFETFRESISDIMFPENLAVASALIIIIMFIVFIFSKALRENSYARKKRNSINHQMFLVDDEEYYPLNADEIIIGRNNAVDICFHEMYVSRYHAIINVCNGTWSITDLNSSYGTFVNGQRISHKRIYDNDEIQIGNKFLIFKCKEPKKNTSEKVIKNE